MSARLKEDYNKKIKAELAKELDIKNPMAVPKLTKIMVNAGVGDATKEKTAIEEMVEIISNITGQRPVINKAKKAVAQFKIREGMDIGVSVTLRGDKMWEFFDKLVNIVLPRTKDFRGVSDKAFDNAGNYSLGIREHTVFPEIDPNNTARIRSLQVTLVMDSRSKEDSKAFLDKFGFPFVKHGN
jgi:large subunit ribosomal protein L5